jgi:transposase
MGETLARWHVGAVRERIYRAGNPRERERWQARWLLARGGSARQVAEALGRDPHTVGAWLHAFEQGGLPAFEQTGSPLALTADQQAALDAALESMPRAIGIELANCTWKAVHAYLRDHFGVRKNTCLRYLHQLSFVLQAAQEAPDQGRRHLARGLKSRIDKVKSRCRTVLQAHALASTAMKISRGTHISYHS